MKIEPTPLAGLFLVRAEPVADERGEFVRTWCRDTFLAAGITFSPLQTSASFNHRAGTLRGLHWQQAPAAETKLVRVTRGRIFDVAVDLRTGSPTRLRWFGLELDADSRHALLIPPGFAHGFITLQDASEVLYTMDAPQSPADARGARWDDPALGIRWPLAPTVMSGRDRHWPDIAAGA
jgi:dTDP-4-dehydrorhamnose 3,5-epimerase